MDSPKKQASKILRDKKMYQRWLAIFMCLALVVTSGTVTALKLTGQAMTAKQLQCSYVPHEHTDECYNAEGELACGLSDKVVHTHDSSCYDAEGALVCPLEELEPHEHDESCYTEVKTLVCGEEEHEAIPAHTHTEECYTTETVEEPVLSCGLEETDGQPAIEAVPGHVHTEECYTTETVEVTPATYDEEGNELTTAVTEERRTLTCGMAEGEGAVEGQPEIPAHHHTEECYTTQTTETQVLACGLEEHDEEIPAHHHTDECYTTSTELTCGKDEVILHVHTDDCYDIVIDEETGEEISRTLTCDMLQLEAHQHGDDCFVEVPVDEIIPSEQPEEELPVASVVYCGKQEHTHTDECYQQDENGEFVLDENGEKILICELEEHVHTEECYVEPEATEPEDERELICGKEEHTHTDECYDAEGNLICELEEHTHTEECYAQPEPELLTATKTVGDVTVTVEYSEDANIPEGAELDFFEYDKDSPEYAQYAEQAEGELDRLFDIGFYLDGEQIEPAEGATIKVNITYPGVEEKRQQVTHFTEEGPVSLGAQTTIDGEITTVEFYTDSFSPFGMTLAAEDDNENVYVLQVGQTQDISVSRGTYRSVSWTSSNTEAVTVRSSQNNQRNATLTAVAPTGEDPVNITFNAEKQTWVQGDWIPAHSEGIFLIPGHYEYKQEWVSAPQTFTVYVAPQLKVTGYDKVKVGENLDLFLTGVPEGVNANEITWTVANNTTGSVTVIRGNTEGAVVQGVREGNTIITASYNWHGRPVTSNSHTITVESAPSGGGDVDVHDELNVNKYIEDNYKNNPGLYELNLTFNASKGSEFRKAPLDVIFIVDISNSMKYGEQNVDASVGNRRLDHANGAIAAVVGELNNNRDLVDARYATVSFNYDGHIEQTMKPVDGTTPTPLTFKYNIYRGGTYYLQGLEMADQISTRPEAEKVVFFISDGTPEDDMKEIRSKLESMKDDIDYFYAIATPNNTTVSNALTSMYGTWTHQVNTGSSYKPNYQEVTEPAIFTENVGTYGADLKKLPELMQQLISKIAESHCSNVTAIDHLEDYVSIDPGTNLVVSIVDKNGTTVKSGNGSVDVSYTATDGTQYNATFSASYDKTTNTINGSFSSSNYELNPKWTYKITTPIRVDEAAAEYRTGGSEANRGAFTQDVLPIGAYTNKGPQDDGTNDVVKGTFKGDTEATVEAFPKPTVPLPRRLNISKVDADNEKLPLNGAVFTLYKDDELVETFTIKENGLIDITHIVSGEYTLVETTAPDKYTLPDKEDCLLIEIAQNGTVTIQPVQKNSTTWPHGIKTMAAGEVSIAMTVKNEKAGVPVEIIKQGVSSLSLEGATFTLSGQENKEYVLPDTTETDGRAQVFFGNLQIDDASTTAVEGTILTETKSPVNGKYQQIDPVKIVIVEDKEATLTGGYVASVTNEAGEEIDYASVQWAPESVGSDNQRIPAHWQVVVTNTPNSLKNFKIFKVDSVNQTTGLAGAEFTLYRAANADDANKTKIKVNGVDIDVVVVSDKIGPTSSEGMLDVTGIELQNGVQYYLVETKAPDGYIAGSEPISLKFESGSLTASILKTNGGNGDKMADYSKTEKAWIVTIPNNSGAELPHTGGIGTQLFTICGGLLMVLAAGLYFWNKRRISEM